MSWTCSIPPTEAALFAQAVDLASAEPHPLSLTEQTQLETAKAAAKAIALTIPDAEYLRAGLDGADFEGSGRAIVSVGVLEAAAPE